jgi:hypothetical protein
MSMQSDPICIHCNEPVVVNRENYDTFEKMHWLCFHLVYEHNADPDEPCSDIGCPHLQIQILREALRELGHDPDEIYERGWRKLWDRGSD